MDLWKIDMTNDSIRDYLLGGGWERERYKDKCRMCEHIPMHTKEILSDVHEFEIYFRGGRNAVSRFTSFRESGITEFVQNCRSLVSVILHKRTYRVRIC